MLDPSSPYRLLRELGLAAGPGAWCWGATLEPVMRIWHAMIFTPLAFFNSPRGRSVRESLGFV